jgi:hypothetical protein
MPEQSLSMPEESLSHPEPWAEHPEHALSQPAHYNAKPILVSCVPRLQFPYRTLPGNPFLLPYSAPCRSWFWIPLVKEHVINSASPFNSGFRRQSLTSQLSFFFFSTIGTDYSFGIGLSKDLRSTAGSN